MLELRLPMIAKSAECRPLRVGEVEMSNVNHKCVHACVCHIVAWVMISVPWDGGLTNQRWLQCLYNAVAARCGAAFLPVEPVKDEDLDLKVWQSEDVGFRSKNDRLHKLYGQNLASEADFGSVAHELARLTRWGVCTKKNMGRWWGECGGNLCILKPGGVFQLSDAIDVLFNAIPTNSRGTQVT